MTADGDMHKARQIAGLFLMCHVYARCSAHNRRSISAAHNTADRRAGLRPAVPALWGGQALRAAIPPQLRTGRRCAPKTPVLRGSGATDTLALRAPARAGRVSRRAGRPPCPLHLAFALRAPPRFARWGCAARLRRAAPRFAGWESASRRRLRRHRLPTRSQARGLRSA